MTIKKTMRGVELRLFLGACQCSSEPSLMGLCVIFNRRHDEVSLPNMRAPDEAL